MAIGDLSNKVSREDVEKVRSIRNPPEYEPGFEPDDDIGGGGDIDDFDSLFEDDIFDDLSSDFGYGDSSGGSGGESLDDVFGSGDDFFGSSGGDSFDSIFSTGNSVFGGTNSLGGQSKEYQRDKFDDIIDESGAALLSIGRIIKELINSLKNRNADDFAYLSRNLIVTGGALVGVSIVLMIIGAVGDVAILTAKGLGGHLVGCGMLSVGTGLAGIGFSAIKVANMNSEELRDIDAVNDVSEFISDDSTDDYEDNIGDILDDIFEDEGQLMAELEEDLGLDDWEEDVDSEEVYQPDFNSFSSQEEEQEQEVDYGKALESVAENSVISRDLLLNTFKGFLPTHTPDFADKTEIYPDAQEFQTIETICLKVLANITNKELEEIDSWVESLHETYFSYEIRLKRIRGLNKLDEIEREMEAYFRESSTDTSVNATADIEGDFYKIIVTKGTNALVTFGDMIRQDYVYDYFLDTGNELPLLVGVSELGEVILEDARDFDTMMIAGKPRSGKSWYVLSILMSIMMFNSPEKAQFVVVDPKESNLFKTLSLMPHVCGIHNDENILEIMRDIIDNEGTRRKKLLSDNKCDDIWALWDKGIKLPVLYLVIDEVITVKNNLGSLDKEFDALMQTMISQLPSQGIKLIFVPHRATGVISKTNRTMISFSAAVRSNIEDVKDILDIKQWNRALTSQGDVAIKTNNREKGLYVRGGALTKSDEENTELIINVAKAFYRMGVDLPDMSALQVAANRDEDYIRRELLEDGYRVQFNAANVLNDLEG